MKKKAWIICIAVVSIVTCGAVLFLTGKGNSASKKEVLRLKHSSFTQEEILARMDMVCRKYNLTMDDLREDPEMWNKLAEDVAYEYAGAEVAEDLAKECGLDTLTKDEEFAAQNVYDAFLSDLSSIGEDPKSYIATLGFTEESLKRYARAQIMEEKLTEFWAMDLDLSDEEGMADYQKKLNYMKTISDEIDRRVADGTYVRNLDGIMLQVVEESYG